jgi:zinc/manganese transport system substrate-binding protein
MQRTIFILIAAVLVVGIGTYAFLKWGMPNGTPTGNDGEAGGTIKIVAAEDFYGNIAAQLGGGKVSVTSILSNPNVDPHEYESSVQDGIAVTDANIVIENGLQYDTWMDKLLSASPNPDRTLIVAGDVVSNPLPNNPHVWYGIDNIASIAQAITNALVQTDPADSAFFKSNLSAFDASLPPITDKMNEIKAQYAGTPVALTETIYLYQTGLMGLNVLTPFNFQKAIAEGNDPSAQDVSSANSEIADKQVKVLIYNSQTITPITTNLQNAATAAGIPIVPVSETMPASDTYQSWMLDELNTLQQALQKSGV